MWRKVFSIFKDEPLTEQIQDNFDQMLALGLDMYISVTNDILDPEADTLDRIKKGFYETDKRINALEQKIRREILIHLSVSNENSADTSSFLLLLNLVKSAERIGDLTKAIFEVFEHGASIIAGEHLKQFQEIRNITMNLFSELRASITTMDARLAKKSCVEAGEKIEICRRIMNEMMDAPKSVENPVAVALLFRYQLRILSHLRKIALAQFAPFDEFGACGKNEEDSA